MCCIIALYGESCDIDGNRKECEVNTECDDVTDICVCEGMTAWESDYGLCLHTNGK